MSRMDLGPTQTPFKWVSSTQGSHSKEYLWPYLSWESVHILGV